MEIWHIILRGFMNFSKNPLLQKSKQIYIFQKIWNKSHYKQHPVCIVYQVPSA